MMGKVRAARGRAILGLLIVASAAVVVPVASNAAPTTISFGVAGDLGANSATNASLAKLNASGVDFFLAIGDLDYGEVPTPEDWCTYVSSRLPSLGSSFPFQLLAGNHEENTISRHAACLPDRLGSTGEYAAQYSFDYPSATPLVRVIMISPSLTINNVSYSYSAGSTRYNWVASQIDDARAQGIPWTAVGMHKHCFTSGSTSCDIGADLMNMLVSKKVDLVFQGHKHTYQRSKQLALRTGCSAVTGSTDPDCVVDDGLDGFYSKGRGTVVALIGCFGKGGSSSASGYMVKAGGDDGFTKFTMTADRIDATFVSSTGSMTDTYSIVPNQPPVVTNPGARTDGAGSVVSLPIVAVDPEAETMAYAATGLPPGLSINPSTGVISGTLPFSSVGSYTTRVTVTDARLAATAVQFAWSVADLPPATPSNLTAVRRTTGVGLDWSDNTELDLDGYNVARSSSASGPFTRLNQSLLQESEFFDETAPAGALSYYQVVAIDQRGGASAPRTVSVRRSAIAFVGASAAKGTGLLLEIPMPAGVRPGDVVVAGVASRGSILMLAPAGWTISADSLQPSGLTRQSVYAHVVTAADPATVRFVFLTPASAIGTIAAYRGSAGVPTRFAGQANPSSSSIVAPSVTAAATGSVQVGFFGIDTGAAIEAPAEMAGKFSDLLSGLPLALAYAVADAVVDGGSLPQRTATASEPATNIGQVVILDPAS